MPRILIIEDEHEIKAVLREVLGDAGYKVDIAPDGLIGTKLFREKPADLVIVDMIMPRKDGMETIFDIKADYPEVKIIGR